jgi:hypothetical protein
LHTVARSAQGKAPPRHRSTDGRRSARSGDLVEDRRDLAVIVVAVDREQDPRLDLPKSIDHTLDAESPASRTTRSRRAQAVASIAMIVSGMFGHVRRDAVARLDPCAESADATRRKRVQLGVRHLRRTFVLAPEHERVPASSARLRSSMFCARIQSRIRETIGRPASCRRRRACDRRHAFPITPA